MKVKVKRSNIYLIGVTGKGKRNIAIGNGWEYSKTDERYHARNSRNRTNSKHSK